MKNKIKPGLVLRASPCVLGMTKTHQELLRDGNHLCILNQDLLKKDWVLLLKGDRWSRNAKTLSTSAPRPQSLHLQPYSRGAGRPGQPQQKLGKVAWRGGLRNASDCQPRESIYSPLGGLEFTLTK